MPTYEQIGIWAPILLVSLRFLQGLALGGEYGSTGNIDTALFYPIGVVLKSFIVGRIFVHERSGLALQSF